MVVGLKRPKGRLACKVVLGGLNYLSGRGLVEGPDKTWLRNLRGYRRCLLPPLVTWLRNFRGSLFGMVISRAWHDDCSKGPVGA